MPFCFFTLRFSIFSINVTRQRRLMCAMCKQWTHSMHTQDMQLTGRENEIPSNHYGNQNVSNSTKLSEIFRQSHEKYRKI